MITRILLLLSITWVMRLTADLFAIVGRGISGRDLILFVGGLFLVGKSTLEIHSGSKAKKSSERAARAAPPSRSVIVQIVIIDIVFSLDSVITAVGMVDHVGVMIAAVVVAVLVMMFLAGPISDFVDDIRRSRCWRCRS